MSADFRFPTASALDTPEHVRRPTATHHAQEDVDDRDEGEDAHAASGKDVVVGSCKVRL